MSWLPNYEYRKKLTVTGGAGGAQTDYQIAIDVFYEPSMASDFRDIRFTTSNGVTEINAWIESLYISSYIKAWVKFPTTPANGETVDYYMYYNNPIAVSNWDIDGTFILADDFSGTSIDSTKWTSTNPPTKQTDTLKFNNGQQLNSVVAYDFAQPVHIRYKLTTWHTVAGENWYFKLIDRTGVVADVGSVWMKESDNYIYGVTDGTWVLPGDQGCDSTGAIQDHIIIPDDKYIWTSYGGNWWNETLTDVGNFPAATRYIHLRNRASTASEVYIYYILVSKYVEGEPTYVLGVEEEETISISVPRWNVYFDGEHQKGIQSVNVLSTIAGSSKTEIVLSDVSKLNDIAHFADIEVWSQCDDVEGGLILDGTDDFIEFDNEIELTYNDFAISWWMKRDNLAPWEMLFSEFKTKAYSFFDVYSQYDMIRFASPSGVISGGYTGYFTTGIVIDDGEWHHYVLNFTTTTSDLYVDGLLADTDPANTDTQSVKINYFGHERSVGNGDFFTGSLAYLTIYDQAIDETEITNLHAGFSGIKPLAFWTLDQPTDNVDGLYDRMEFSHGTSYINATTPGALSLDTSPLNQFIAFKGRIDLLLPDYDTDTLSIVGRDYLSDLLSRASVEDYTTRLRSYIVNDTVQKYGTSMSRNNIEDSPTGTEISYLFKNDAWSTIVKCGQEDGYKFFCDTDKDFHYSLKGWNDSGITLEVGVDDILTYNIIEQDSDVINRIIVYGYDDGLGDQVIVQADDLDSQNTYGVINEKKIVDAQLLTNSAAEDFAYTYLEDHSIVLEIIEMEIIGNEMLKPGDLIHLIIPTLNIDSEYLIIDKALKYPSNTTTVRVARYAKNLEKILNSMVEKILGLESQFMDSGSGVLKLFRVNEACLFTDRVTLEKKPASTDAFLVGVEGFATVGDVRVGSRGSGQWETVYDSGY